MANLRNIKDRITSIKNTQKITNAMKMVAAAKVKKAENLVRASRPFTRSLYQMFVKTYKEYKKAFLKSEVKEGDALKESVLLLDEREIKTVGLVIISSNKGLAGAYCANVIRYSEKLIKEYNKKGINVKVYIMGSKAVGVLKNLRNNYDFDIEKAWSKLLDDINSTSAYVVAQKLANDFKKGKIDSIQLVTTRYKNMMSYQTQNWQMLPVITDENVIKKFQSKELDEELNIKPCDKLEPIGEFLPDLKEILIKIVPMYITNILYQALLEAQASELASRMTAMSAAVNNANDMISTLTIEYNKARQAKITQELTEVISGASMV